MSPGLTSTTVEVEVMLPLYLALIFILYWPGTVLIRVQTLALETESMNLPDGPSKTTSKLNLSVLSAFVTVN